MSSVDCVTSSCPSSELYFFFPCFVSDTPPSHCLSPPLNNAFHTCVLLFIHSYAFTASHQSDFVFSLKSAQPSLVFQRCVQQESKRRETKTIVSSSFCPACDVSMFITPICPAARREDELARGYFADLHEINKQPDGRLLPPSPQLIPIKTAVAFPEVTPYLSISLSLSLTHTHL